MSKPQAQGGEELNAKPRDLRAGWEIFRRSGYQASLEGLNTALRAAGFNPISERSYRHYHKLVRSGYERYVPINQLDVETLRDPIWDTSLRARYRNRSMRVDAILVMVLKDRVLAVDGETVELSEVDALIRISGPESTKLRPFLGVLEGIQVLAVLGRMHEGKSARIDVVGWSDSESDQPIEVRISFLEIIPTRAVAPRAALPGASLRFSMDVNNSQFLATDVRSMNLFLQGVESARIVCDEVLAQLDIQQRFAIDPPRMRAISKSNPITIGLDAAIPVVVVFSGFVGMFLRHRITWQQGTILHQQGNILKQQANVLEQKANVVDKQAKILDEYARSIAIQNAQADFRHQVNAAVFVPYIVDVMKKQLPSETVGTAEVDMSLITKLIDQQLLPSIQALVNPSVNYITQETSVEAPPLKLDGTPE